MTSPCVNPQHFYVTDDGAIGPQPWMQLRSVGYAEVDSRAGSYGVTGGVAKNDLLQDVTARWTNDSPIVQALYGIVTRGGSQMILTARSRATLQAQHGFAVGAAAPAVSPVSNFGVGVDRGAGTYHLIETREGAHSSLLMFGNRLLLAPGQTGTARAVTRFVSAFWETANISGGGGETESSYVTGELRIDLFAYPVL